MLGMLVVGWKRACIKMNNHFLFIVLITVMKLVDAQDQSGFIMIDCGIPENTGYTDAITGIYYVADTNYISTGTNAKVSDPTYVQKQFNNLRSFPEGEKNCYTIVPPYIKGKTKYFIKARFVYDNYDGKNRPPTFDIYLGVNYWATVDSLDAWSFEVLHTPTSNYTYVCLVNTGLGTPFISVLELRLVEDNLYTTASFGSMQLFNRYDLRAISNKQTIRYPDDVYDRKWDSSFFSDTSVVEVNTTGSIAQNAYSIPATVMKNAITPRNTSAPLEFTHTPPDPTVGYYVYFHFADFQLNDTREMNIYFNNVPWELAFKPAYLSTTTIHNTVPEEPTTKVTVSIAKSSRSILPPLLNAFEIYSAIEFPNMFTENGDVDAIKDIKATYGVERNWQGDPCSPRAQLWEGLDCFNASIVDYPRIISLNLSYSGLTGISPLIFNLSVLQRLDLSFNDLTGEVPNFLTQMSKLKVLNLSGNNFTGKIPAALLVRAQSGSLVLSMEGNPYLCKQTSCDIKPGEKKKETGEKATEEGKKMIVIGIAVGVVVIVLLIAFGIAWECVRRRRLQQKQPPEHPHPHPQPQQPPPRQVESVTREVSADSNYRGTTAFELKNKKVSYSELLKITQNFRNELGGGGFGEVYHGYLEGNQVAVKMLSPTSAQGYKQFKAEAELLTRVHHRNLTILVGYCDEGEKLGLIYEFMAKGDLRSHLSERSTSFLPWETRIEIAVNAAQGLDYLHTGCKPPIIHRDVKSTNILLDDKFQAKLGDFGLSKVFPTEDSTHVSTAFAGTPGYVDPEFNMNEKSDVYSFGVVLLELITGQPAIPRTEKKIHISKWVGDALAAKGDVRHIVDPRIGRNFDVNSMWKAVDLAMECVSATSATRPVMNNVVIELKTCLTMEKSRTRTGYRSESNRDSIEVSSLYIETAGFDPVAR